METTEVSHSRRNCSTVECKFRIGTGYENPKAALAVQFCSFFNLGARWDGMSKPCPGRSAPGKETQYPSYKRLGRSQGRSGRARKILFLLGFHPGTVQDGSNSLHQLRYCRRVYNLRNVSTEFQFLSMQQVLHNGCLAQILCCEYLEWKGFCKDWIADLFLLCLTIQISSHNFE
jgi:hypothetical protein